MKDGDKINMGRYRPIENEIFHVHTWRCKHAGEEREWEYIERAIELGAERIVFTDHCPFPGDLFRGRMDMSQLPEYIATLQELKTRYKNGIEVLIGLEAEYLPTFHGFYKELYDMEGLDLLVLGQHMFEHEDGQWSFQDDEQSMEYVGLCEAINKGIASGFFDVVAHPDRSFRRCKKWTSDMEKKSREVVECANFHKVFLEKNYSSMRHKRFYWTEFWNINKVDNIVYGYDAHAVTELNGMVQSRCLRS